MRICKYLNIHEEGRLENGGHAPLHWLPLSVSHMPSPSQLQSSFSEQSMTICFMMMASQRQRPTHFSWVLSGWRVHFLILNFQGVTERQNACLACWRSWVQTRMWEMGRSAMSSPMELKRSQSRHSPLIWPMAAHCILSVWLPCVTKCSQAYALVDRQEDLVAVSSSKVILLTKIKSNSQGEIML